MLALIMGHSDKTKVPLTYVRGSKKVIVERAKELVSKLNSGVEVSKKIKRITSDYKKFSFQIIHSIDEIEVTNG